MTTIEAWKILKGECTLPEAMRMQRFSEDNIKKNIDLIKQNDVHDSCTYYGTSMAFYKMAYAHLIKEGEIDATKIFNAGCPAHGFDESKWCLGDIGIMGDKTYRYTGKEWEFMY